MTSTMGIPDVNVPAGTVPRPVETIDLDSTAQRANEQAIGAQPAGSQSGQSGSKKSLVSAMKSISPKKFSSQDKDQDVELPVLLLEDWINQMDRFMRVIQVDESLQLDLAASCLTGPAYKALSGIENMRRQWKQEIKLDFFCETLRTGYGQIFPEQRLFVS